MTTVNRRITLAARPVGFPKVSDFHLGDSPLPSPADGEVLVRSAYLSLDPDLRGRMSGDGSSAHALAIGDVVTGGAVGYVVESAAPKLVAGDAVEGMLGWQEYAVAHGRDLRKVDLGLGPISTALGVLGLPGHTAYFGLVDICDPQRGETVVVSGAAGAVGMLVGQIAKIKGCRVVGVAGSDTKVSWLRDELGFDRHSTTRPKCISAHLDELAPGSTYFDNEGGQLNRAVKLRIKMARDLHLPQSSQDNLRSRSGPRWWAG